MPGSKNEIIKTGYKKMPTAKIPVFPSRKIFNNFKYPVNELGPPKGMLFDSMAVCQYSNYNIGKINAYLRSVMQVRFPEMKFALRKQNIKDIERVVVFRIR